MSEDPKLHRMVLASFGGLTLRRLQHHDARAWYEAIESSRDDLARWEIWPDQIRCEDHALGVLSAIEEGYLQRHAFFFGLFHEGTDKVLGSASIHSIHADCNCASLGYWIAQNARGANLASWASSIVAQFAFDVLKLTRLEIAVRTDNLASIRVARKLGAVKEGTARARVMTRSGVQDADVFSLVTANEVRHHFPGGTPSRNV